MKNLSKIFMILTTIALISCGEKQEEKEKITIGGNNSSESVTGTTTADTSRAATTSSDENVVEIRITGNDQMQFNTNEIRVKAGQTVRLTLEHVGNMQKNVMGHNFVLLEQGTNISQFGQAAASAQNNDYIPQNTDQVIAYTKMLGGGESDTIEFQAPEVGSYDFICSFPGHYALMQGKFIVE